jgi:hypothetical protein
MQIFFWFVSSFEHVKFAINEKYFPKNFDNPNYYASLVLFQTYKNVKNVRSFEWFLWLYFSPLVTFIVMFEPNTITNKFNQCWTLKNTHMQMSKTIEKWFITWSFHNNICSWHVTFGMKLKQFQYRLPQMLLDLQKNINNNYINISIFKILTEKTTMRK